MLIVIPVLILYLSILGADMQEASQLLPNKYTELKEDIRSLPKVEGDVIYILLESAAKTAVGMEVETPVVTIEYCVLPNKLDSIKSKIDGLKIPKGSIKEIWVILLKQSIERAAMAAGLLKAIGILQGDCPVS